MDNAGPRRAIRVVLVLVDVDRVVASFAALARDGSHWSRAFAISAPLLVRGAASELAADISACDAAELRATAAPQGALE